MKTEVIPWTEPSQRHYLGLAAGDLVVALGWYKETTGQEAGSITLNPVNEGFASEVKDINVNYCPGCLRWEIWLSDGIPEALLPDKVAGYPPRIMSISKRQKISMDIIQPATPEVIREKRGPKHRDLPETLIRRWEAKGLGSRAIATKLEKEKHITVSYRTIQRLLNGQRVLV